MKTTYHLLLITALAVAGAQAEPDSPKETRPTKPKARAEAQSESSKPKPKTKPKDKPQARPENKEESAPSAGSGGVKTPFIGVAMEPVPPSLRAHFGIPESFGVMVGMVLEDSPAAKAGIRQHDLILRVDDQRIVNMEQLKALISSGKKGDVVEVSIITKGKDKLVKVTLAEKVFPVASRPQPRAHEPFHRGQVGDRLREWERQRDAFRSGNGGAPPEALQREWREKMEMFQERMRDFQGAMERWHRGDRRGPMPQPPMMQPPGTGRQPERGNPRDGQRPPEGGRERAEPGEFRRPPMESPRGEDRDRDRAQVSDSEIKTSSSKSATISRRDESGEYVLSRHGRGEIFTVRPKQGDVQTWDLSHDEARASIPPSYLEKLEMLEGIRVDQR